MLRKQSLIPLALPPLPIGTLKDIDIDRTLIMWDMSNLSEISPQVLHGHGIDTEFPVYRQVYEREPLPDGVVVIEARVFTDEHGGHFMENIRLENGILQGLQEKGIKLDIRNGQINTSVVAPRTERFGHLHPHQDELWIIADGILVIALYDDRNGSSTRGKKTKLVLGKGNGVFIPHGVVHGLANYNQEKAVLNYFATSQFFTGETTEEWRFVPDDPGFWDFAKPENI